MASKSKIREIYEADIYTHPKFSEGVRLKKRKAKESRNRKALAQINEHVKLRSDYRVLDIGCGRGDFLSLLPVKNKYGVEINPKEVKRARAIGIDARALDVENDRLPYPDNYMDLILCMEVLEHLFNPSLLMSEMKRVLKKGGHIYATVPNDLYWLGSRMRVFFGKPFIKYAKGALHLHIKFFNKEVLSNLFEEAGFKIVYAGGFHSKSFPASLEKFFAARFTNLFVSTYSIVAKKP
ncbi:MAG: methyltransferase domain-containing protein [Candidatus Hadarchaeota archaeon]